METEKGGRSQPETVWIGGQREGAKSYSPLGTLALFSDSLHLCFLSGPAQAVPAGPGLLLCRPLCHTATPPHSPSPHTARPSVGPHGPSIAQAFCKASLPKHPVPRSRRLQTRPREGMRTWNHTAGGQSGTRCQCAPGPPTLLDLHHSVTRRGSRGSGRGGGNIAHPRLTAGRDPETGFSVHTCPTAWTGTSCLSTSQISRPR